MFVNLLQVTVSATDADIGVNGQFTFKITAGDDDRLFSINGKNDVLTVFFFCNTLIMILGK